MRRLLLVFCVLLGVVAAPAFADTYMATFDYPCGDNNFIGGNSGPSILAVMQSKNPTVTLSGYGPGSAEIRIHCSAGNGDIFYFSSGCSADQVVRPDGSCGAPPPPTCSSGTHLDTVTNTCVADKTCTVGTSVGTSQDAVEAKDTICLSGCTFKGGDYVCLGATCTTWGPFKATGGTCTSSPTNTGTSDPTAPAYDMAAASPSVSCPSGQVAGTDGTCAAATSSQQTSTASDGKKTTVATDCTTPQGPCDVTTTITDPVTGATTTAQSGAATLSDLCRLNPSIALCQNVVKTKVDESGTPGAPAVSTAEGGFLAWLETLTPSSLGLPTFTPGNFAVDHAWLPEIIGGSDSCETPDGIKHLSILGHDANIDLCTVWQPYKDGLRWFLYAMTAFFVFYRLSRLFD